MLNYIEITSILLENKWNNWKMNVRKMQCWWFDGYYLHYFINIRSPYSSFKFIAIAFTQQNFYENQMINSSPKNPFDTEIGNKNDKRLERSRKINFRSWIMISKNTIPSKTLFFISKFIKTALLIAWAAFQSFSTRES